MLGIGFFEIIIILAVAMVALGPKDLPHLARKLAGFYKQFLALKDEFNFQLLSSNDFQDLEKSSNKQSLEQAIKPEKTPKGKE